MPIPILVPDVGAADANTFADLDFYKTYIMSRRPQPVWAAQADAGLLDADLTVDLLASCEILNAGLIWTGEAATDEQALIAPRVGWVNRNGKSIAQTVIPIELKKAQCELGVQLHEDALTESEGSDVLDDDAAAKFNVKSVKAGSISVDFQAATDGLDAAATRLRLLQSQFDYLNIIPRAVRLLLVSSWYEEVELSKGFIFEPL